MFGRKKYCPDEKQMEAKYNDIETTLERYINVVKSEKDVVAIPTVKKSEQESYDIFFKPCISVF